MYNKVSGTQNSADVCTKYLSADVMDAHMVRSGFVCTTGDDNIGLSIHALAMCNRETRQYHAPATEQ